MRHVADLEAQSQELQNYKENEAAFEEEKEKFYQEVVFSDKAPDISAYKEYYESIEPQKAEEIYKQVVEQLQEDERDQGVCIDVFFHESQTGSCYF